MVPVEEAGPKEPFPPSVNINIVTATGINNYILCFIIYII